MYAESSINWPLRVPKSSLSKWDQVHNLSCENESYLHEHEKSFHIKGWALNLVLIQRPGGTRKWPIDICIQDTLSVFLAQFVCLGCTKKSLSLLFINALSVYENLNGTETRTCKNWSLSTRLISVAVADPGEGAGGPDPPPLLFLDQTETRRAEKYFFGDRPTSLNFIRLLRVVITPYRPPYLRV